jgi:PAS domain S-box
MPCFASDAKAASLRGVNDMHNRMEEQVDRDRSDRHSDQPGYSGRGAKLVFLAIFTLTATGEIILAYRLNAGHVEAAIRVLLGVALTGAGMIILAKALRDLSVPMNSLERSMRAFASGASAEEAGKMLPDSGSRRANYIYRTIIELFSQVQAKRKDLELEVARRTVELEFRNALLRAINSSDKDSEAYAAVAEIIRYSFSADRILFAYFNGSKEYVYTVAEPQGSVGDPDCLDEHTDASPQGCARPKPLEPGAEAWLSQASRGTSLRLPFLCFDSVQPLVFDLSSQGQNVGYIALARDGRPFEPDERATLSAVFVAFALQLHMHEEWSRQEHVRQAAELSLRRSEEQLRSFFEESKDMIYSSNAEDVLASINTAGVALLGYSDRLDVLGTPMANFVMSPEDREHFIKKLRDQGFAADYECIFKRRDGSTIFCVESANARKDRDGRVLEIQGIVKDISDRIANERELWKSNLELAEANEKLKSTQFLMVQHEKLASIGQLAAGIAHEINNPLGFLKSNHVTLKSYLMTLRAGWGEMAAAFPDQIAALAERLDIDYIFAETDALLAESDDGYTRIIDIVKNLRSFARAEASPAMEPYDLNKGIESTLVVARNEYKYCAEVELELGELPPIKAAGGEINQVILNMIVNAAQAIEEQKRQEKGRIRISTRIADGMAILEIEDDGPGIPEEERLKVFDPFYTTKEPGKGTGLGLSISYDIIVRKHGGRLTIHDSRLGGALFQVALPLVPSPQEESQRES